jgi:hypothetical protein
MKLSAFAVIAASAALAQVSAAPAPIRLLVISPSIEEDSPLNGIRFGHPVAAYRKAVADREFPNISPPLPAYVPPGEGIPTCGKPVAPPKGFHHPPCFHGRKGNVAIVMHRIKIKAIKIGNCFRKALGWPLIEVRHHRHHHHHHHHAQPTKPQDEETGRTRIGGFVNILPFPGVTTDNSGDWAGVSDGGHKGHFHKHHGSFLSRLHHSLMNLGRWEGRAVAFVVGMYPVS